MRFSIRDLLWATLAVALVIGWGWDHWRLAAQRDHYRTRSQELMDKFIWAPLEKFVDELETSPPAK